ncbi:hypothetical protein KBD81_01940 [Candidatus Woesebacteria bacterium]|nr:hypothetical protein [Candidatus Woesebacteria bacterium]
MRGPSQYGRAVLHGSCARAASTAGLPLPLHAPRVGEPVPPSGGLVIVRVTRHSRKWIPPNRQLHAGSGGGNPPQACQDSLRGAPGRHPHRLCRWVLRLHLHPKGIEMAAVQAGRSVRLRGPERAGDPARSGLGPRHPVETGRCGGRRLWVPAFAVLFIDERQTFVLTAIVAVFAHSFDFYLRGFPTLYTVFAPLPSAILIVYESNCPVRKYSCCAYTIN